MWVWILRPPKFDIVRASKNDLRSLVVHFCCSNMVKKKTAKNLRLSRLVCQNRSDFRSRRPDYREKKEERSNIWGECKETFQEFWNEARFLHQRSYFCTITVSRPPSMTQTRVATDKTFGIKYWSLLDLFSIVQASCSINWIDDRMGTLIDYHNKMNNS